MARELRIDATTLLEFWSRDPQYSDQYVKSFYLNLETGELAYICSDEYMADFVHDIQDSTAEIEESPENFLELPGWTHGDHHEMLRAFLDSPWTKDVELQKHVKEAYKSSIGKWREKVTSAAIDAFESFKKAEAPLDAERFFFQTWN